MGFLTKVLAGVIQGTVGTAVGVASDIFTCGNAFTEEEPDTLKNLKGAKDKLEESFDDLSKGDLI